jgi:hypothetical protein
VLKAGVALLLLLQVQGVVLHCSTGIADNRSPAIPQNLNFHVLKAGVALLLLLLLQVQGMVPHCSP